MVVPFTFATNTTTEDELGIWQPLPSAIPREFSVAGFGPETTTAPALQPSLASHADISVWQVDLPQDARAAASVLAGADRRLALAENALPQADARLAAFRAAGGLPPMVGTGLEPEAGLAEWVAASQSGRRPADQNERRTQVAAFFDRVRQTLRNYAAIDTRVDGVRTALTLVSWTGDVRTTWATALLANQTRQHTDAVALALRTRDAWLRLALTVTQGAIKIITLFSVNPALALPATYQFVRQVIDQVQALDRGAALA